MSVLGVLGQNSQIYKFKTSGVSVLRKTKRKWGKWSDLE
jgi:hypothetical protein